MMFGGDGACVAETLRQLGLAVARAAIPAPAACRMRRREATGLERDKTKFSEPPGTSSPELILSGVGVRDPKTTLR
jgi:hypothetical protein